MAKNNISIWNAKFDHTYKYTGKNGIHYEYLMPKNSDDSRFFEEAYDVRSRNNKTGRYQPIGDKSYFTFYQLLHGHKGYMKLNLQLFAQKLGANFIQKIKNETQIYINQLINNNNFELGTWEQILNQRYPDVEGRDFYDKLAAILKLKMAQSNEKADYKLHIAGDRLEIEFVNLDKAVIEKVENEMNEWLSQIDYNKMGNIILQNFTDYYTEEAEEFKTHNMLVWLSSEITKDSRFLGWLDESNSIKKLEEDISPSKAGDYQFLGIPLENKLHLDHFRITQDSVSLQPLVEEQGFDLEPPVIMKWKELLEEIEVLKEDFPELQEVIENFFLAYVLFGKFVNGSRIAGFTNSQGEFLSWPDFMKNIDKIKNVTSVFQTKKSILWYGL